MKIITICNALLVMSLLAFLSCLHEDTDFSTVSTTLDRKYPGRVSGYVYNRDSTGISNVAVSAGGNTVLTNRDGKFEIGNMGAGIYDLNIFHPDYGDTEVVVSLGLLDSQHVEPQVLRSRFAQVQGHLTDEEGNPIAQNLMAGVSVEGQVRSELAVGGGFTLDRLNPGLVRIYSVVHTLGFGSVELDLVADSTYRDVAITVDGLGGSVRGRVLPLESDEIGELQLDARVTVIENLLEARTDSAGYFEIPHVPSDGDISITIRAQDTQNENDTIVVVVSGVRVPENGVVDLGGIRLKRAPIDPEGVFGFEIGNYSAEVYPEMNPINIQAGIRVLNSAEFAPFRYLWDTTGDGEWDDTTATPRIRLPYRASWEGQRSDTVYASLLALRFSDGERVESSPPFAIGINLLEKVLPPIIAQQPESVEIMESETAVFSVDVEGSAPFVYRWYLDGELLEANSNELHIESVALPLNGSTVYCQISNRRGVVKSDSVQLIVNPIVIAPEITEEPESVTVEAGDDVTFAAVASGSDLSYIWEYSSNGEIWLDISELLPDVDGSLPVVSFESSSEHGDLFFRCRIENSGGSVITEVVTITFLIEEVIAPEITEEPESVTAEAGDDVTFAVVASGSDLSYIWEYSSDGEIWLAISELLPDVDGSLPVVSFESSSEHDSLFFRCRIENSGGSVITEVVTITFLIDEVIAPEIAEEPESVTVEAGDDVTFAVVASGSDLSYIWEYSSDGEIWLAISELLPDVDGSLPVVSFKSSSEHDGLFFRCRIENSGGSAVTEIVTITLTYRLNIEANNGNVNTDPTGEMFEAGMKIALEAIADDGYRFSHWDGTDTIFLTTMSHSDTLTMPSAEVNLAAVFEVVRSWIVTGDTLTDPDGNVYTTVTIGNQVWTVQNLRTTEYADGTPIPHVTDGSEWGNLSTPAYCWYNNDPEQGYGTLYNWWVVDPANPNSIAPEGWRVPTDEDWDVLRNYLIANGYSWDETTTGNNIGKALASSGGEWFQSGTTGSVGNDQGSNNSSGFSALPGGYRDGDGYFNNGGSVGHWWSATESDASSAWFSYLHHSSEDLDRGNYFKRLGWSVRLLRDSDITVYPIHFKPNGGEGRMDPQLIAAGETARLHEVEFTLSGHSFTGWNTDPGGGGQFYSDEYEFTMGTEGVTLYAQWQEVESETFTITIETQGQGSVSRSPDLESYEEGTVVTLTANSATGWVFSGWSRDISGTENSVTIEINSDMDVMATFEERAPLEYPLLLDDFESGTDINNLGGAWGFFNDHLGEVVFSGSYEPGYQSAFSAKLEFDFGLMDGMDDDFYPYAGITTYLSPDASVVDLTDAGYIQFVARADYPMNVLFRVETSNITDHAWYGKSISVDTEWSLFTIAISGGDSGSGDLAQPSWTFEPQPWDPSIIHNISWQISQRDNQDLPGGTLWIDDIFILEKTPFEITTFP
ncbi:hypothetical protein CHISP_3482 [Chitinispirillum alkaliphilum]|nr:hypothetical protein CHISP_3482 [Chitinispirillum alkaliphilum]